MHDAAKTTARRAYVPSDHQIGQQQQDTGRARPGGKKRGLANLTLTASPETFEWLRPSRFRFVSSWTLRRQGTCVLSYAYRVHCLWFDA